MSLFKYQELKEKDYFEGWYIRVIDDVINLNFAVIFGVTKEATNPHAFIQIARKGFAKGIYRAFDLTLFNYHEQLDTVTIGNNELSTKHLLLDIDDIKCNISFETAIVNKKSMMGFFQKLPLECYQDVIIPSGKGIGKCELGHDKHSINATIYIEKTYGYHFPKKWLWLQSQHAENTQSAVTLSSGKMPFRGVTINGFFAQLITPEETYLFASYNLSKLIYESHKEHVTLTIIKPFYKLVIDTAPNNPIKLVGPTDNAKMTLDVFESITAEAKVTLYKRKKLIFEDTFKNVGFENTMN